MSFKVPPDRKIHKTEKTEDKEIETQARPARHGSTTDELIMRPQELEIQMSSSSEAAVDKLKQVINGKLKFDKDKNEQSLKRTLENLEIKIREKKIKFRRVTHNKVKRGFDY